MSDNKSQSIDHDMQSDDAVTTESDDCEASWEVFYSCGRNDTSPPVCASIVFDLTEPEGERRLCEMLDAGRMKLALWEFDRYLHDLIKYGPPKPDVVIDELQMVRKAFWNILDYQNIRLDEE